MRDESDPFEGFGDEDAEGKRSWTLRRPIKLKFRGPAGEREEPLQTITLRRATGKEMLLVDKYGHQPMRLVLQLIAALSDIDLATVEKLDADDIGPLGNAAGAIMDGGRPTGATV